MSSELFIYEVRSGVHKHGSKKYGIFSLLDDPRHTETIRRDYRRNVRYRSSTSKLRSDLRSSRAIVTAHYRLNNKNQLYSDNLHER